jgi:hypothetical protein
MRDLRTNLSLHSFAFCGYSAASRVLGCTEKSFLSHTAQTVGFSQSRDLCNLELFLNTARVLGFMATHCRWRGTQAFNRLDSMSV